MNKAYDIVPGALEQQRGNEESTPPDRPTTIFMRTL